MSIITYMEEIKELLKEELPQLAASLNGPATEAEIAQVESRLGISLPDELRSLYLLHNGEESMGPGLFMGLRFLPLEELAAEWQVWADLEADFGEESGHYSVPLGWIEERYINRGWLPISEDGGGNHLGVDMAPASSGVTGQIINFGRDEETKYVIALTLGELLKFIRDTVKEGQFSVERDEEWVFWTYGREGNGHFLDAVRALPLPLGRSALEAGPGSLAEEGATGVNLAEQLEQSLDAGWLARIKEKSGSVAAFLKAKQLYFIRDGLTDAGPFAYCSEVRELVLSANEISDAAPLSGCTQLKVLYIGGNPIMDVSALSELAYLQELYLTGTGVIDISPLAKLPKLKKLVAENVPIVDYSSLSQSKSLRSLAVSNINGEQLRTICELEQLQELSIQGFADDETKQHIGLLSKLKKLKSLQLKQLELDDLTFAAALSKLEGLKLDDTSVADISAVAECESLKELELNGCERLGHLEAVAKSSSLQQFAGSFAQFNVLKELFVQKVDMSKMIGSMTKEEEEIWLAYNKA
ncbi:Cell wall assembly regulator SMI1 [Paenibacillus algorifonticola]|uniref:Cell wall assembly regulator SMI1 n=1 Tax=Paenibacillus algorifonticola TaxID=684063 RepID=A0A1I2GPF8_9BACL|nr:SMI1/KNR4 family protein [Paenibacillus algorifonticola]SFF19824.1 Cell wall assembly regulator SMI1 [Paenibacillus algorifonticola]